MKKVLGLLLSLTAFGCNNYFINGKGTGQGLTLNQQLQGTWTTGCIDSLTSGSMTLELTFSGNTYSYTYKGYSGAVCGTLVSTSVESGTYELENYLDLAFANKAAQILYTVTTDNYTLHDAATVNAFFNANSFCGFTNWSLNTTKSIFNKTCSLVPPLSRNARRVRTTRSASGGHVYEIIGVDDTGTIRLYLSNNLTYQGNSASDRPVALDGTFYLSRQ